VTRFAENTPARDRLRATQERARRQADRDRWRWDKDGPHPVFAALAAEAHAIIGEHGIEMTTSQRRTIAWIANDDMDTLADVVELIVSGRGGNPA
jgi:hypothetical protein